MSDSQYHVDREHNLIYRGGSKMTSWNDKMMQAITGRALADRSTTKRLERQYSHLPGIFSSVTKVRSENAMEFDNETSASSISSSIVASQGSVVIESDDSFTSNSLPPSEPQYSLSAAAKLPPVYPSRPGRPNLTRAISDVGSPSDLAGEEEKDKKPTGQKIPRNQSFDEVWLAKGHPLPPMPPLVGIGRYRRYTGVDTDFQEGLLKRRMSDFQGPLHPLFDVIEDEPSVIGPVQPQLWAEAKSFNPRRPSDSPFSSKAPSIVDYTDAESGCRMSIGFGPSSSSSVSEESTNSDCITHRRNTSYHSIYDVKSRADMEGDRCNAERKRHMLRDMRQRAAWKDAEEECTEPPDLRPKIERRCIFKANNPGDSANCAILTDDDSEEEDNAVVPQRRLRYQLSDDDRQPRTIPLDKPKSKTADCPQPQIRAKSDDQPKPRRPNRQSMTRPKIVRAVTMPRLLRRKSRKSSENKSRAKVEQANDTDSEDENMAVTMSRQPSFIFPKFQSSIGNGKEEVVKHTNNDEEEEHDEEEDDGPADLALFMVESKSKCKASFMKPPLENDRISMNSSSTNRTITQATFRKPMAAVVSAFRTGRDRANMAFKFLGNEIGDKTRSKEHIVDNAQDS